MKTTKIEFDTVKNYGVYSAAVELGLEDKVYDIFEYGEFASFEIIVDENLNIVGGKIIPHKSV